MLQRTKLSDLAAGERELALWRASQKYVSGEISREDLEEIEIPYTRDFNDAMIELSRRRVKNGFLKRIRKLYRSKK